MSALSGELATAPTCIGSDLISACSLTNCILRLMHPNRRAMIRELEELELELDRAWTHEEIRRRREEHRWMLVARGREVIKKGKVVVQTSRDVDRAQ